MTTASWDDPGSAFGALYPLFTRELIQLMRRLIPAERQDAVAVVVTALLPVAAAARPQR